MCGRWRVPCAATAASRSTAATTHFISRPGRGGAGSGTRVHLSIDAGERPLSADLDGVLSFDARAPRFEGAMTLGSVARKTKGGAAPITPWRGTGRANADHPT